MSSSSSSHRGSGGKEVLSNNIIMSADLFEDDNNNDLLFEDDNNNDNVVAAAATTTTTSVFGGAILSTTLPDEIEQQFQQQQQQQQQQPGVPSSSSSRGKVLSKFMMLSSSSSAAPSPSPSPGGGAFEGGGRGEGGVAAATAAANNIVFNIDDNTSSLENNNDHTDNEDNSSEEEEEGFDYLADNGNGNGSGDDDEDYYYNNEFMDILPGTIRSGTFTAPSFAATVFNNTNNEQDLYQNIDTELAQEMNGLTLQQREKALYDVHGVNTIQENPGIVTKAIKDLDTYLYSRRNSKQSSAYQLALSINKSYVESNKLRLLFLRGHDMTNIIGTGKMILHHFQLKKELFGDSMLCKDITQNDLCQDDLDCINNGQFQYLPVCDQGGRQVFIHFMGYEKYQCAQNLARAMWYITLRGLNSKEAQQQGIVTIGWSYGGGMLPPSLMFTMARTKEALPVRQTVFHLCDKNEGLSKYFVQFVRKYFMPTHNRIRTRLHFGNRSELLESISKFGIPVDVFPMTESGELKLDRHHGWMKTQELMEASERKGNNNNNGDNNNNNNNNKSSLDVVSIPTQSDILLGRGKACQYHIGNMRFRLMLESQFDEYDKANKLGKSDMAYKLVQDVKSSGGRFLSLEKGMWIQVSDLTARKKVSHRFRAIRGEKMKNTATTTTTTTTTTSSNNNNVSGQRRVEDNDDGLDIQTKRPRCT